MPRLNPEQLRQTHSAPASTHVIERYDRSQRRGQPIDVGTLARCSQGDLGILTEALPRSVTYPDGSTSHAYVGMHIGPKKIGLPWSSRIPSVIRPTSARTRLVIEAMVRRARRLKGLDPPLAS